MTRRTATTVAVIIPAHDAAAFLPAALDSVFAQTRPPDEVILVDDGSTDDTEAVVRSHSHAARIRYLRQEHAGVAAARNAGLREARAEWIAFLDADDLWLPHRIEAGLELAARRPDVRWCAGAFVERKVNGLEMVRGLAPPAARAFPTASSRISSNCSSASAGSGPGPCSCTAIASRRRASSTPR